MATPSDSNGGALTQWYSNKIGQPQTADEARGYWVFALGVILGIVGIGLLISSNLEGPVPQWPVVIAGIGLVLLVAGPLIRLPLRRVATYLVYLGAIVSLVAVPWFLSAYPGWRPQATSIIGLYAAGLLIMAIGGVFVPILTAGAERESELARQRSELAELQAALDDANADRGDLSALIEQLRADQADTEASESDLAAQLHGLRASQARFELYEDRGQGWRWRLRHRNGNVIADSGEGYSRKHNAQKGLASVRRNALGATTLLLETEAELPPAEEEFEPVEEAPSQADFELYKDNSGEFRWRLRHDNGNVLADSGESYGSRGGAQKSIEGVQQYVGPADYLRADPTAIEVYQDNAGEFRWRLVHKNGNILADSGEGYARASGARRALDRIRENVADMEFEVSEDNAGEYRWRLRGGNNQIMADSGEGYESRDGAQDAVERVRSYMPEADTLVIGQAAFEVYEDNSGEFRWRLRHRNGNILGDSGEGYAARSGAWNAIESVKRNAPAADVETD